MKMKGELFSLNIKLHFYGDDQVKLILPLLLYIRTHQRPGRVICTMIYHEDKGKNYGDGIKTKKEGR